MNTIYCGTPANAESRGWAEFAEKCGGRYMNIDQNKAGRQVAVKTEFDDQILKLNEQLNGTYVAYAVTTDGYKGKAVKVDWRLLTDNGAEQARLLETQPSIHVNADHDRATYSTWVQDPLRPARRFSIELDLYDSGGNQLDQATRAIPR